VRTSKVRAAIELLPGQVIASFGRTYRVELATGLQVECATRGKRSDVACGDRVQIQHSGDNSGVIDSILPRVSLLYRSDAHRQKLIAANVTQVLIVVAPIPSFYDDLISRCLAACEHANIRARILLNKTDLAEASLASAALDVYRQLGYSVLSLSAKQSIAALQEALQNEVSVLVGQSGMGKSTIVNQLAPEARLRVAETSLALDSGRHTTTGARLLHINEATDLIDSPGLQSFGLHHLDQQETAHAFVEFRPWLGQCRFRDCTHRTEPGCAIQAACLEQKISTVRMQSYRTLIEELLRAKAHRFD